MKFLSFVYPFIEKLPFGIFKPLAYRFFFYPIRIPFPPSEKECLETAETSFFVNNNIKICLYQWGNKKAEKKILLVHGWAGRATQFREIIKFLEKDYHIYAFDSNAHGQSEGDREDFPAMSNLIQRICFEHQINEIIGHSFGAGACLYSIFIRNIPIRKCVLMAAPTKSRYMLLDFAKKINAGKKTIRYIEDKIEEEFQHKMSSYFLDSFPNVENDCEFLAVHSQDDIDVRFDNVHILKTKLPKGKIFAVEGLGHNKILRNDIVLERVKQFLVGL